MTSPQAAPATRRRLSRGLFGALVAFLILPFPPLLLVGPLAGLLVLSRPGSLREWLWLALAALMAGLAVGSSPRTVVEEVSLAFAAVHTGVFAALVLLRGGPAHRRAAAAAVVSAGTVGIGCAALGISWAELTGAVRAQLQTSLGLLVDPGAVPPEQLAAIREGVELVGRGYPGLAVLGAMAGGTLAAALVHRVARHPVAPAPGPFREFRFNDHLIWGALLTFGAFLLPIGQPGREVVGNVLLVWAGLYLARGVSVAGAVSAGWPVFPRVALFLSAVLLLPYALGALLLLGVADTWIDIRRAQRPSPSGGSES